MRDQMQVGDGVLFYASNADPSGVTGLAEIARAGLSGPVRVDEGPQILRPGQLSGEADLVHGGHSFVERFPGTVSLETLKQTQGLEKMMVTRKGARLSVQPVTKAEFDIVTKLGRECSPARHPPMFPRSALVSRPAAHATATSSSSTHRSTPTRRPPRFTVA